MLLRARAPHIHPDIESWARAYVLTTSLQEKLAPPPVPLAFGATPALRIDAPGRPPELFAAPRREKSPKPEALTDARLRARVFHTFFHHELQAAELMCWAILAFPDAEPEFRKGLLGICLDEIRHMNLYANHIASLGHRIGEFGVRDWFWRRVPTCTDKIGFVAVMGMGFEAANLEYATDFAARFRAAGDEPGAAIQDQVHAEELSHVAFGTHWFKRWTGGCDFTEWIAHIPPPLSPAVLHGTPIARTERARAGMSDAFIDALAGYIPEPKGRPV